jgi:IMP dehydrogenase
LRKEHSMRVVQRALTFDDVLLVPAHSSIIPRDVRVGTRLTRGIALDIPLISAAMDTVTDSRLAIAIAQEGGLGIVHKNMSPRDQAAQVAKVKRFESGVLKDPITIPPTMSVREVKALTAQHRISAGPAGGQHHDPARAAGDRAGGDRARAGEGADAQAPPRARAGDQRRVRA